MAVATISALSLEAIRVPVSATGITAATLVGYTIEVAVLATAVAPVGGDWKTATWTATSEPDYPAAKLVIGPTAPSGITLTAGTTYYVWVRVTGGGQTPVVNAGALTATT